MESKITIEPIFAFLLNGDYPSSKCLSETNNFKSLTKSLTKWKLYRKRSVIFIYDAIKSKTHVFVFTIFKNYVGLFLLEWDVQENTSAENVEKVQPYFSNFLTPISIVIPVVSKQTAFTELVRLHFLSINIFFNIYSFISLSYKERFISIFF